MDATWIVSANASRAHIFSQAGSSASLEEVESMVNAGARLRTAERSAHGSGNATPNKAFEPHQTPVEHQTERFARDVANVLLKGQQHGHFRHLCVVASPEFLGYLRQQMDPNLAAVVSQEINKDYTHESPAGLQAHIKAHQARN
jgi:protein required for attachment to host cells